MKRAALTVPFVAILVWVGWSAARSPGAVDGVCAQMTPARMLENPAFAHAYGSALGSGDAEDVARLDGLLREIRSLHGCGGDEARMPASPHGAPRLPPGHPPIRGESAVPAAPVFQAPGAVTI